MSKLAHSDQSTMDEIDRAKFEEAEGRKIITTFVYPPIPVRNCDWSAHLDGDEPDDDGRMTVGRGETEADAIKDLIEQVMS